MRLHQKDGPYSIMGHMFWGGEKCFQRLLRIKVTENQRNGCRGVGVPGEYFIKDPS